MPTYTSEGASTRTSRQQVVEDGAYNVAIIKSEDATSAAGNPLIKLRGEVRSSLDGKQKFGDGEGPLVFESLVFIASCAWKLDQFRSAIGEIPEEGVEASIEADDLLGVVVPCFLKQGKTNQGGDCMDIAYFITEEDEPAPAAGATGEVF